MKAGARVVAITSGGKLGGAVRRHGWPSVRIPGEATAFPVRFCLTSVMHVLHAALGAGAIYQAFGSAADHLIANQSNCIERAEALADLVEGKQVLLYSDAAQKD